MHSHLSALTWNAGARCQAIDISLFAAGTWSYVVLQALHPLEVDRLESLQCSVISAAEAGLAVAMPHDFLREPGQLLEAVEKILDFGQWALRALFARFELQVPEDWLLRRLVVGSVHVNNRVASQKRRLRELLQHIFAVARRNGCDILGGDFKQGLHQLSTQFQLWIQKEDLEPVPATLLHREGDCCGYLISQVLVYLLP